MGEETSRLGRLARTLLVAGALAACAVGLSLVATLHPARLPRRLSAARVIVPGTEDVLALQEAADAAQAAADARNPHNLVFTADHSVFAPVGAYRDCSGQAALTHSAAAIDTCIGGLRYFIGHNPGVFSGLMSVGVGGLIGYYDGSGRLTRYEVVAARTWLRQSGVPPPVSQDVAAQFQTCITPDGSVDRILDAVAL